MDNLKLDKLYSDFINDNPLKRTTILGNNEIWTYIDCYPKINININTPEYIQYTSKTISKCNNNNKSGNIDCLLNNLNLSHDSVIIGDSIVFLHGIAGTAGEFFGVMKILLSKGYRVLSVQYPIYDSIDEWCRGFDCFLDILQLNSIHLYGNDLGGYLSLHFKNEYPQRVKSLILCNTFISTMNVPLSTIASTFLHLCPHFILVKLISDIFNNPSFHDYNNYIDYKYIGYLIESYNFVMNQIINVSQVDLAGRLSLLLSNTSSSNFSRLFFDKYKCSNSLNDSNTYITIITTSDSSLDENIYMETINYLKSISRVAQLKYGGDFPHLSNFEDIAIFCQVHLRNCGAKTFQFNKASTSSNKIYKKSNSLKQTKHIPKAYEMPYPGVVAVHDTVWDISKDN
ncbi:hypothetical protein cand_001890 [Cryptosporidium andersoni]|uniref:Maspardin n=1 Tax=Cryptosporidium andersoni TaxID=117008 RepID=A0A1J4MU53_9CRYT|nr:hypothetical protein cand_001890 [Cryptosporidium andersoni]